jgi:hypothetical protein
MGISSAIVYHPVVFAASREPIPLPWRRTFAMSGESEIEAQNLAEIDLLNQRVCAFYHRHGW